MKSIFSLARPSSSEPPANAKSRPPPPGKSRSLLPAHSPAPIPHDKRLSPDTDLLLAEIAGRATKTRPAPSYEAAAANIVSTCWSRRRSPLVFFLRSVRRPLALPPRAPFSRGAGGGSRRRHGRRHDEGAAAAGHECQFGATVAAASSACSAAAAAARSTAAATAAEWNSACYQEESSHRLPEVRFVFGLNPPSSYSSPWFAGWQDGDATTASPSGGGDQPAVSSAWLTRPLFFTPWLPHGMRKTTGQRGRQC